MKLSRSIIISTILVQGCNAFTSSPHRVNKRNNIMFMSSTTDAAATSTTTTTPNTKQSELSTTISKLKQILTKEYITFFNPMVDSWYAPDVTFVDPMTSLSGVDSYRNNVDMLAGRTLLGKILFEGAGINLHSVTGGEVNENGDISDIVTRWTLRMTVKVLPWSPGKSAFILFYHVNSSVQYDVSVI